MYTGGYVEYLCMDVDVCTSKKKSNIQHTIIIIAGNFGEVFNLANWRFHGKSPIPNPNPKLNNSELIVLIGGNNYV